MTVIELVVAALLLFGLVLVVGRLLRVGCSLFPMLIYVVILAVAASLLYSLLRRMEIVQRLFS